MKILKNGKLFEKEEQSAGKVFSARGYWFVFLSLFISKICIFTIEVEVSWGKGAPTFEGY